MPLDPSQNSGLPDLLAKVRACAICEGLPLGPKPILQAGSKARILIAGQAPGKKAHERGIPFDDASGDRLRQWLGVDRDTFYDTEKIAVLPMGFCFPGTSKNGDLPPRAECAPAWRDKLLAKLESVDLTIVIGQYAQDWHLGDRRSKSLTETVANWRAFWPEVLPLPHPSPRNQRWFKQNPFFEEEILPELQGRVGELIG
ncbi:uracil-DNA glycosylase family protein [Stappia sp. GBMRC 2046]|uniref:Uracil-DNA glycosylase family protein n=1 Tax=Stappia sediminis TaxID=2692190 RepID=A0A7X3S971_9HYPH|nr:uracil-DNA glycosylase family protein [Stappia sediminis]MXN66572.1 uracil-DNA glycosylase family protein [Stappia sediminis]